MIQKSCPAYSVLISLAGDYEDARRSLRRQCLEEGLCVTVDPTLFIYTAGAEDGVRVRLINYPRYPKTYEEIWDRAAKVALTLLDDLYQHSVLVEDGKQQVWYTKRPEEQNKG